MTRLSLNLSLLLHAQKQVVFCHAGLSRRYAPASKDHVKARLFTLTLSDGQKGRLPRRGFEPRSLALWNEKRIY